MRKAIFFLASIVLFLAGCGSNSTKDSRGDSSADSTKAAVEQYRSRISGPLLDRIDLSVDVQAVPFEDLNTKAAGEPSEAIRARVNAAREIQQARFSGSDTGCNAKMTSRQLRECCVLDTAGTAILRQAFDTLGLTARSHDKILKVARTIADLDGSETIQVSHLAEALSYRSSLLGQG